jgi:uncharacterized membrane protein YhaH (DUF805 family)
VNLILYKQNAMKHYLQALHDYKNTKGRMSRSAFCQFVIFFIVFWVLVFIVNYTVNTFTDSRFTFDNTDGAFTNSYFIVTIYNIIMLPAILTAMVRRLHDTGYSGKWTLLLFAVTGLGTFLSFQSMFQIRVSNTTFTTNILLLLLLLAISMFGVLVYKLSVAGDVGTNKYGPDPREMNGE